MLRGLSLLSPTKLMGQRQMSSLSRFDLDTALNRVKDFHYRGEVTDRWSVGNAPNGGYLMMMAINAAKQCIDHPDPLSITAYYANKSIESHPVDIAVRIVTKARSSTTVHITMSQAGDTKSEYLAVFGDVDKFKGFSFSNKPTLSLPPRQDCLDCTKTIRKFGKHVKLFQELQILLPKDDPFVKGDGFFHGKQGEKALLNCWVKFEDVRKPCLPSLAFFLDALPPPVVNLTPTFWVPTLELTIHFWSKPPLPSNAPGGKEEDDYWLQGKFETIFATNGTLYTDAEIWSADGNQLLATSRQYARILDPKNK